MTGKFQKYVMDVVYVLPILITLFWISDAAKPNIILVLTDDQDTVLGGEIPMVKTKALIGNQGIIFKNAFVNTPLCCPSRASIITGRYVHNHRTVNNSFAGECNGQNWVDIMEPNAFAPKLKEQGYQTLFAGKYMNQYHSVYSEGLTHIPPGWDSWYALAGNSRYYKYTVSNDGKAEKHRGNNYKKDYFTDRIRDRSLQFLAQQNGSTPFFMMLSVPACHAPFVPAPQYADRFEDVQPPTDGSYNTKQMDKHWLMRQVIHPMERNLTDFIQQIFRKRWRTLLSVDDMIEDIVNLLTTMQLLENTYMFFTSDNGFHLGQFSLPYDKRQLYEFDIRVPHMVRGPGITPRQIREEIVLNIDLAPTFIDLAGGTPLDIMDGVSMKEIFDTSEGKVSTWRTDFLVEHEGEHRATPHCPQWDGQNMSTCFPSCVCQDSQNNTYNCVRTISSGQNTIYCEFQDDESFVEAYDLDRDPHQMVNIASSLSESEVDSYKTRLAELSQCQGPTCRQSL